jgi:hypothetical protein
MSHMSETPAPISQAVLERSDGTEIVIRAKFDPAPLPPTVKEMSTRFHQRTQIANALAAPPILGCDVELELELQWAFRVQAGEDFAAETLLVRFAVAICVLPAPGFRPDVCHRETRSFHAASVASADVIVLVSPAAVDWLSKIKASLSSAGLALSVSSSVVIVGAQNSVAEASLCSGIDGSSTLFGICVTGLLLDFFVFAGNTAEAGTNGANTGCRTLISQVVIPSTGNSFTETHCLDVAFDCDASDVTKASVTLQVHTVTLCLTCENT